MQFLDAVVVECLISLRHCWTIFPSDYTSLHSHQQWMSDPISLHPCRHLVSSLFFNLAILRGVVLGLSSVWFTTCLKPLLHTPTACTVSPNDSCRHHSRGICCCTSICVLGVECMLINKPVSALGELRAFRERLSFIQPCDRERTVHVMRAG